MKKLLSAIIAASILFASCATHRQPVPFLPPAQPTAEARPVLDIVAASISRFSIVLPNDGREVGSCTAFSIAPRRFMTAAHCVDHVVTDGWGNSYEVNLKVDTKWAVVASVDKDRDLAVVIADVDKPALGFREDPLVMYEDVYGVGYGYGFVAPLFTPGKAEILDFVIEIEGRQSWPGTVFMGAFIGGMSGGPIVDKNGAVVGVVQAGGDQIGYGVSVKTIKEFLAKK